MNAERVWAHIVEGMGGVALLVGPLLVIGGRKIRRRGLGSGRTVSIDRVTLTSWRYGLTGRPDWLIRTGVMIVPEEWNSSS